jgi:two-component system response regulator RegA
VVSNPGAEAPPEHQGEVMVVDDQESHASSIRQLLIGAGMNVLWVRTFSDACVALRQGRPQVILSELKIGRESLVDWIPRLAQCVALDRVVVVTNYPSIATAVHLVREGVADYLAKPVSTTAVLQAIRRGGRGVPEIGDASLAWASLDRTIWEYLQQVYAVSGNMSEAARRLRIDRRSLRRMLNRHPPSQ